MKKQAAPGSNSRAIARSLCAGFCACALALTGCARLAETVTGDYLGAEPTVESEVISEPTENAVQAAIAAEDARGNVPYIISEDNAAEPAASDITWQQAANAAEAAFEAAGGAGDGESWTLAYRPAEQAGGRSGYACSIAAPAGNARFRLDGVTADVVQAEMKWPEFNDIFARLALTEPQITALSHSEKLTAQEYAQLDEIYKPLAKQVNLWLEKKAESYLAQLAPAFGFDVRTVEGHAEKWPDTAQEFLEQYYTAPEQSDLVWMVTILDKKYELAVKPLSQKMGYMMSYVEETPPAADAAAPAPATGWYEQAADGTWYHVGPDGTSDPPAAQEVK